MSDLFNVVFRGDILPGQNLVEVKQRVGQLFKLDDAKLAAVFSGKPVVLKKDCDLATAEKIKAALTKAGAESEIKSSAAMAAAPAKPAAPTAAVAKPAAAPVVAAKPVTPVAPVAATKPVAMPTAAPAATPAVASNAAGLKVAPVGQVLTDAERAAMRKPPVQVKTDHISLEKRASAFGAADEKPAAQKRPEIQAPNFGVAAAGADLLKPEEKRVFEEHNIDLSAFKLAEVGADMLPEDQKIPLPVMEIEELSVDLAPVGADMGEVKKAPPPPPPKIDHIKLA